MNIESKTLRVSREQAGQRLDQFIPQQLPEYSRRSVRRTIDEGAVSINRKRCRKQSYAVRAGDVITILMNTDSTATTTIDPAEIEILLKSNDLLAVNKPAGINALATQRSFKDCLHYVLEAKFGKLFPVHRIDRETSGALIFARSKTAASKLSELFREHQAGKSYLAVCSTAPPESSGEIDQPLLKNDKGHMLVDESGKPARTIYRLQRQSGKNYLLELNPSTGRTHQLRAHLQFIGCPILGDRKYGGEPAERMMLHAWRLEFGWQGERLKIEAPSPF